MGLANLVPTHLDIIILQAFKALKLLTLTALKRLVFTNFLKTSFLGYWASRAELFGQKLKSKTSQNKPSLGSDTTLTIGMIWKKKFYIFSLWRFCYSNVSQAKWKGARWSFLLALLSPHFNEIEVLVDLFEYWTFLEKIIFKILNI